MTESIDGQDKLSAMSLLTPKLQGFDMPKKLQVRDTLQAHRRDARVPPSGDVLGTPERATRSRRVRRVGAEPTSSLRSDASRRPLPAFAPPRLALSHAHLPVFPPDSSNEKFACSSSALNYPIQFTAHGW